MEKRTEKTEKKADKDMKRTEFAQEYNLNTQKQNGKTEKNIKNEKTNKLSD